MAADCKSATLRVTEVRILPCAPAIGAARIDEMPEGMSRATKKWISLAILAGLAGLAWTTIEPGKIRLVVLILIASFALRIVLATTGSRYDDKQG